MEAQEVLDRLLYAAQVRRDAQLAEILGVTPQAVSQARKKNKVPESWLLKIAGKFGVSVESLAWGDEYSFEEHETPEASLGRSQNTQHAYPNGQNRQNKQNRQSTFHPVQAVTQRFPYEDTPATYDLVLVPLVSARLAAGTGSLETEGDIVGHFAFRQDWLCKKGNPDKMVFMEVTGDSMEPAICSGDMVLVDQSRTQILGHAIYAVGVNEEIYIKQVETLPGGRLVLRSINERYAPIEVLLHGDLADSVRIIGRVIWLCRDSI